MPSARNHVFELQSGPAPAAARLRARGVPSPLTLTPMLRPSCAACSTNPPLVDDEATEDADHIEGVEARRMVAED